MDYTMNRRIQSRKGNQDDFMAPHNCYPCKGRDRWISIAIATKVEWEAFCDAIGNPVWTKEKRFSDMYTRWENQDELDKLIGERTINYTDYEVMEILQKFGVAAVPSFSNEELFKDIHIKERGAFVEVMDPELGKRFELGVPWKLSATPIKVTPVALSGEHNEYVFGELLGMSTEEIATLMEKEIIY